MKNNTIAQHVTLPPAILGAVAGLLAVLSIFVITSLTASTDSLAQGSLPALGQLSMLDQPLFELRRLVILQAFAKDPEEAHSYDSDVSADLEAVRRQEREYGKLPAESQDRQLTRNFESSLDPLSSATAEISDLSRQGKKDDAVNAVRQRFLPAFDAIANTERRRMSVRLAAASQLAAGSGRFASSSLIAVWAGFGIALTLGVLLCLNSRRRVSRELMAIVGSFEDNAGRLAAGVSEVSSSGHALSNGCSQQAASIEEISSSIEEMSAMTLRNSENSARASSMMADTSSQISRSNVALKDMIVSMDAIKASSEKVAKINRTIDDIAFQTNILALNAAVEAARAGDAGMGFAVVADEVRNLAQRSAAAAKDTAFLIEEAIENTQKGSRRLDQVASVIKAITEGGAQVGNLIEEVKEASSQQAQGITQISQAILHVSKITQQAAAGAEEGAAASEELGEQARSILNGIQSLQALAGFSKTQSFRSHEAAATPSSPAISARELVKKLEPSKKSESVRAFAAIEPTDPEDFLPMDSAGPTQSETFSSF
ncbi:MAG TPA: methyl-accepting chemotaxis protein [Bryobacteraceae bacterium]|jgi:methyl-accepting chemotaxis protein|nr:methyl-accepting chemotaxis protein [Bryobacteraceae bacterium]